MSRQNVDIARRAYELADREGTAVALQLLAPDFELDMSSLYPDAPVIRGIDNLLRWTDGGPWGGSTRLQAERFFDVDDERVLVFIRGTATGEGSGVPVEIRDAHELTIRDGLIVRCKVHRDQDAALEAVGLSE
jgi:ketosteroid isomerase-like protein